MDTSLARAGVGPGALRWTVAVIAVLAALAAMSVVGANAVEDRHRRSVDERLAALADEAAVAFTQEVAALTRRVREVARDPQVARGLAQLDAGTLESAADGSGGISFWKNGRLLAGAPPGEAGVTRTADVTSRGDVIGRVVAALAFDEELAGRLARSAEPLEGERVGVAVGTRLYEARGAVSLQGSPAPPTANVGGEERRVRVAPLLLDRPNVAVVASTNAAAVDAEARGRSRRILAAAAATLLTLAAGVGAFALWRSRRHATRRNQRMELDRRHVRDALSLVGDALAATHDANALLPVITQTAMEAAGATEARLLRGETEIVRVGRRSSSRSPLVLPLGEDDEGSPLRLLIYAPGGVFTPGSRELAEWFVSQAAIALENARLHGIVKRQAITDDLTGLANRRRFIEALEAELSRAERFGSDVAVVIGDLDDFKSVNDRFGHEFGNDVLRSVGQALLDSTRDIDVAARLGGEEFAVLLPQTDVEGATIFAERLRDALARLRLGAPDGSRVTVTASFGVSAYPPVGTVDALLRVADSALYEAKAAGKDRVVSG